MGQLISVLILFWIVNKVLEDKKRDHQVNNQDNNYFNHETDIPTNTQTPKESDYFKHLDYYFTEHSYLKITEEISVRVTSKNVQKFEDLLIYRNNNYSSTFAYLELSDKELYQSIVNKLDHIVEMRKKQDFLNDTNRNAVEDSQEIEIDQYINYFQSMQEYFVDEEATKQSLHMLLSSLQKIKYIEKKTNNKNDQIEKLYSSYLPMFKKIVDDYQDLRLSYKDANDIEEAREKLVKTMTLVNQAVTNILTNLITQDVRDLTIDMDVLESLLKQDGYIEDELTINKKRTGGGM